MVQFFDFLEKQSLIKNKECDLYSSWGNKMGFGSRTLSHDHLPSVVSGVIYLNDHNQKLIFKEIEEEVIPKKGSFALFSPILKHHCTRNYTNKIKYGISFNLNVPSPF